MRAVTDAAGRGVPVIGVCNGFQVLTEAGLLPGALMRNARLSFVCRPVPLRVENSQSLFQQLRAAKVPTELHVFEGVPHAFDSHPEFAEACAALVDLFLDRKVLHPRTYPPFGAGSGARGGR